METTLSESPFTSSECAQALSAQAQSVTKFFSGMAKESFLAPQGTHWAPEQHLRHLTRAVRTVTRAMQRPKIVLLLRFGPKLSASDSLDVIRERYLAALGAGAQAGPFSPDAWNGELAGPEWCEQVLQRWQQASAELTQTLATWSEASLNRIALRHPILGKMSVREIVLFTLVHNAHHLNRVQERAG